MTTTNNIDVIFECNTNAQRSGSTKKAYELILSDKSYRLLDTIYIERPYNVYALKNPFKKKRMLLNIKRCNISNSLKRHLRKKLVITSAHSTLLWTCYSLISGFEEVSEGMQEIIFPIKQDIIKRIVKRHVYSLIFPTAPKCRYVFSKNYVRSKADIVIHEKCNDKVVSNDFIVILNTEGKDDGHFGGKEVSRTFITHNLNTISAHAKMTNNQFRYVLKTHPALGNLKIWLSELETELTKKRIDFCYADQLINCEDSFFVPTEYYIEKLGIRNILLCDVTSTVFNFDKTHIHFSGNSKSIIEVSKRNKTQYVLVKRFFQLFKNMVEV